MAFRGFLVAVGEALQGGQYVVPSIVQL